jgi:hypothetical protein
LARPNERAKRDDPADTGHDPSHFDEIVASDYVNDNAFAESGLEGSHVVGRYHYEGTHSGNFLGYPATGNASAMRSIDIESWRRGRDSNPR